MSKNFFILVFIFLTITSYGQKSTLLQNINFRAKELKHSLNKEGDSLILQSNNIIYSVEIFNQNFEKTISVKANKTKIALSETPLGRLVVQAKMADKRILMTLLRHEHIKPTTDNTDTAQKILPKNKPIQPIRPEVFAITSLNNKDIKLNIKVNASILQIKPQLKPIASQNLHQKLASKTKDTTNTNSIYRERRPSTSISSLLNWKPKKKPKSDKTFWISYVVNSGTNTRKTMKMMHHNEVDQLIKKLEIENKTPQAKLNTLTVWEIYNPSKFIEAQVANPDYIYSTSSNLFNVVPYYSSTQKELVASN